MTAVDVVWVSRHKPEIIPRGYWDQALLEALFDRSVWRPVCGYQFVHRDGFDELPPDAGGAVVVIPARHHAGDITWINEQTARLAWLLVILTGDEERDFPIDQLAHPNMRVWVQTPDPVRDAHVDRVIGDGWSPGTPAAVARGDTKTVDWFFAGQNNNPARQACIATLSRTAGGTCVETAGFTQGLDHDAYLERLAQAKVAPCPAGIFTPDTFRLFEALEAGCVPVADRASPRRGDIGYWSFLFGAEPPFPTVKAWDEFPDIRDRILADWPATANRVFAWWQDHKRDLAYGLNDDIGRLTATTPAPDGTRDLITVLMPTSPTPGHPDTGDIETVITSLRTQPALEDCEIIILADGPRPDTRPEYAEYLRRLLWKANNTWHNVLVLVFDQYLHQAARTRAALDWVRTPLVFFVEHDTPIVGDIDFDGIARVALSDEANLIRLHHEASVLPEHEFLMVDHETRHIDGVPLRRTADWSQRPHVAKTSFYRELLATYIGWEARTFIETVMYGVVRQHWHLEGEAGWARFRLWLYAPDGTMQRSIHLDSRRGDPLCPEVFAYDGPTPEHAPNPRSG